MRKAKYKDEDVEFIRAANSNDPGFSDSIKSPMLIRDGEGLKHVVPGSELLVALSAEDAPDSGPAKVVQTPSKGGKK